MLRHVAFSLLVFASAIATAQHTEISLSHHASGTFTVQVKPMSPALAEGVARYSIDKVMHGGLEATTQGEMLSAGDPKSGAAGYVALELVTGSLDGHKGSFALQHWATMDASGPKMQVAIVPGSGTGDLKGITGTFTIQLEGTQHNYTLDYELPDQK